MENLIMLKKINLKINYKNKLQKNYHIINSFNNYNI